MHDIMALLETFGNDEVGRTLLTGGGTIAGEDPYEEYMAHR
jgi:hypothetical protein